MWGEIINYMKERLIFKRISIFVGGDESQTLNLDLYPTADYAAYSLQKNYPRTSSIIEKLIMPKIDAIKEQLDLLDSNIFRKYRKYMIYLFQKK